MKGRQIEGGEENEGLSGKWRVRVRREGWLRVRKDGWKGRGKQVRKVGRWKVKEKNELAR